MNVEEIPALVAIITALWPNAPKYRREHMEAFHLLLGNCETEGVKRALASIAAEGGAFPPNAGQLLHRYSEIMDPVPDWGTAWQEAIGWVRAHGYPSPPNPDSFSHPAVYIAVERIGYQELCLSKASSAEVWMGHFRRIYEAAVKDVALAPDRAQVESSHWKQDALEAGEDVA